MARVYCGTSIELGSVDGEELIKAQIDHSVTIIFIARDHQQFISDCVLSAIREFPEPTKAIFIDAGSHDGSIDVFAKLVKNSSFDCTFISSDRSVSTLENVATAVKRVSTSHFILISCDDAFGKEYGATVGNLLQSDVSKDTVYNFTLEVCAEDLERTAVRKPNWSNSVEVNKRRLSYGNPGTVPGAIFPTKLLKQVFENNKTLESLIEDYWFWWQLVETTKFVSVFEATVLYRKHDSSTSTLRSDKKYAQSLARAATLPMVMPNRNLNRFIALSLIPRWIRHLSISNYVNFIKEYINATRVA